MIKLKESGFEKIFLFVFCTGAFLYYGFFYNDHVYQKEQLQLFETTFTYLLLKISNHGGIADYLGEFLVQFFGLPYAGAVIISASLALLIILARKIIRTVTAREPLMLFTFLPAAGYFVLLQDDFYSFSGMVGFLLSLAASLFYLRIKKPYGRMITGIILIPLVYWLTGAAYFTFTLIIIVSEIVFRYHTKELNPVPKTILPVYLLLAIVIPLTGRWFIFEDTLLQAYISESYYRIRIFFPLPLILILVSIPLFIVLQEFLFAPFASKPLRSLRLNIVSFGITCIIIFSGILFYGDFRAEKQIAYDNLVYHEQWEKIIEIADKDQPADQISMVAVNLALAKTNVRSSGMFNFIQNRNYLFPEYERREMTPFLAGEPFYHLGLINFAQMFAMETVESTPDVKYPSRSFIRLASTYIINGQYDLAKKYLEPLSHTIFYRKWANDCISILGDEAKINAHPYWGYMRGIKNKYDFYYNAGQMDIALRFLLISNPGNKVAYKYLMAYYLLNKNLDGFLEFLPLSEKLNYNELPKEWEEAAVYIATRMPEDPPQLTGFSVSQDIILKMKAYADLFSAEKQDTARIRKEFGKTYWYYLHFVK